MRVVELVHATGLQADLGHELLFRFIAGPEEALLKMLGRVLVIRTSSMIQYLVMVFLPQQNLQALARLLNLEPRSNRLHEHLLEDTGEEEALYVDN